ncbi:MAG: glycosyltransferase family 25 protein [Bauldia sp.]
MRILVINLDRSPDRLAHMSTSLHALGLEFERLSGIDGKLLDPQEREDFESTHRRDVPWLPGEVGIFLSHVKAWRQIAASSDAWSLILEDDVRFSPALPSFIQDFARADFPTDALIKIETMGNRVALSRRPVGSVGPIAVHRLRSPHMGAAGYLIAREMAETLAKGHSRIKDTVDAIWIPSTMKVFGARLLQTLPALVVQDHADATAAQIGLPSVVDADRQRGHRETFRQRLKRSLRKPLSRRLVFGRRVRIAFAR